MIRIIFKLFVGLVVLPGVVGGALYYLDQNGFFNIEKIEIVLEEPVLGQEQFLKPLVEELNQTLEKQRGISLWKVRLTGISQQVSSLEWVKSSLVKRNWPATLAVHVRPHEVKLLYLGKKGQLLPIIEDGSFLQPVEAPQAPDVALLEGANFEKKSELRKKAVVILEEIPLEGSFSRKTISEIRHDSKEGFWMTMIKTGIQVKLGEDQVALKSARVSKVVDYLESHQFDARVIDANLSKKVLVRLRKGP